MRKVEFAPDQLGKEAFETYSNSDYNFFVDENTEPLEMERNFSWVL